MVEIKQSGDMPENANGSFRCVPSKEIRSFRMSALLGNDSFPVCLMAVGLGFGCGD